MTTETDVSDIQDELMEFIEEQADANFRANVPAGTILSRQDTPDGSSIQITKGRSMVSAGDVPLPERTRVYDTRNGNHSDVPTAQLAYQLNKRRPEDGSRVYSRHIPKGITPPTPIEDTCQICYKNRGNRHRNFYSEFDLLNHMQVFHTLEWNAMERSREIEARRDESSRLERLIIGLVGALKPEATAGIPEDIKLQLNELQARAFTCDVCSKVCATAFGLQSHMRSHNGN